MNVTGMERVNLYILEKTAAGTVGVRAIADDIEKPSSLSVLLIREMNELVEN